MVSTDPRPALWVKRRDELDRLHRYQDQRLRDPCDGAIDRALARLIIGSLATIAGLEEAICTRPEDTCAP